MAKSLELLLVENVDNLGIVGDVVRVRTGYARNYLLPRSLATTPSEELIKQLAGKRADAERQLALLRKQREELVGRLQGIEVTLIRSCNDMGILYGAITQQDVSAALGELGHGVKPRDVRLAQTIKRVDSYDIHVKLDTDLDAQIKLHVKPDRELELHKEGEVSGAGAAAGTGQTEQQRLDAAEEASKATRGTWGAAKTSDKAEDGKGEKKAKKDEHKAEKHEKHDKAEKHEKAEKKPKADAGEKKSKKK
jgi:large subunit ribosomal protein L9